MVMRGYVILGMKEDDDREKYQYLSLDAMKGKGYYPKACDYNVMYRKTLGVFTAPVYVTLERLFEIFNLRHPNDYKGHSMSVSDIVGLVGQGGTRWFFCDWLGFTELPDFDPEDTFATNVMSREIS